MRARLAIMSGAVLASLSGGCVATSAPSVPADPAVILANKKLGAADGFREGYIGEGDDRIHYVEAGSGPPVIFVHGFPAFWYIWFDQMEALSQCRRVIAIDAPGANLSAKPASTDYYRIENLADRLDAVIAQLAPDEQVTLVGHDWGGVLAWSYAERDSERIERLAIFSAAPFDLVISMLANDTEQRARSSYMERFLPLSLDDIRTQGIAARMFEIGYREMIGRGVLAPEEGDVIRRAIADPVTINAGMNWYRANVPAFAKIEPAIHAWPAENALTSVPTLLIRGGDDRTFVSGMGDLALAHAPNLEVRTIEAVGHWTPFENPEAANALLGDFIGARHSCQQRE